MVLGGTNGLLVYSPSFCIILLHGQILTLGRIELIQVVPGGAGGLLVRSTVLLPALPYGRTLPMGRGRWWDRMIAGLFCYSPYTPASWLAIDCGASIVVAGKLDGA